jgi:hypothetical protein
LRNKCRRCAWSVAAALAILIATPGAAAEVAAPPVAPAAPQAAQPASPIDPASLVLLTVELDSLTLTDGLAAYGAPEDPLIPVGEFSRLLELDMDVMPAERRIVGRIGEARRSLLVDLATGTAKDGPRTVPLGADDVVATPNEIYMKVSALQKLLPLKFELDPEALSMKVIAMELLPVQSRIQRTQRRDAATGDVKAKEEVMKVETPYRLFSMPAFDMVLGVGAQTETPRFPLRYDIRMGGDLAFTGFQGYVGSDELGQPSSARFLFERRSVDGRLLGPLHARVVSAGDVFTPPLSLGPRSVAGRGVSLSTVPLDQTNVFNRIDLRGELPLGYDVELYVNDVLRSGQNTPAKGRYEFLSVPLSQGVNVVRIVTYGPRGERSEETRIINVGGGQLRKGEATFEFAAVQQDKPLFQVREPNEQDVISKGAGGLRTVANLNYGLTQYMTVNISAALIPTLAENDYRQIYNLGARTSLFGFATQLDYAIDDRGSSAAALGMAGELFGVSTVLRHAEFLAGFIDENSPGADLTRAMARRSEISLDGNVQLAKLVMPVSARIQRNVYDDGMVDLVGSARASATLAAVLFSAGMEYQRTYGSTSSNERLSGYFAGSTFRGYKWQLRSTLDFDILPELKARTLAITADRDISKAIAIRLGVGQSLESAKSFNLTAAGIFKLHFADFSVSGDYNNADQAWRLGAQMSFGLNYSPVRHGYAITRPGPGSGGSMLFEAFLDRNGNGIFDGDDQPVGNVALEGAETRTTTGPDGRAFITGLGAGPTARLLVGLDNVDNTSVVAPPSTIQFSPRPGSFTRVRYPMKPTGDVMVRVMLRRNDGKLVGLAAAQVRLVGDNGHIGEAGTEFDGSAIFQGLPVGNYKLELDPEQSQRLRMQLVMPLSVTIKGDGGLVPDGQAEVQFVRRPEEKTDTPQ